MRPSPSLAELQRWMRWTLTHPLGVDRALCSETAPELAARFARPPPRALDKAVATDAAAGRTARDRLSIHAGGYFSRLHGTLEIEYPRLAAALGPERFRAAVAAHLLRHPSTSASLADLGATLSETLEEASLAEPWCVELALLERALAEVWLSDAGPFPALALPPGQDWADLRLLASPALRLLRLAWDVSAWEPGDPPPGRLEHALVVWRSGGSTAVERVEHGAASLLAVLLESRSLGDACAVAEAAGLDAETMTSLFSRWSSQGWFARVLAVDAATST